MSRPLSRRRLRELGDLLGLTNEANDDLWDELREIEARGASRQRLARFEKAILAAVLADVDDRPRPHERADLMDIPPDDDLMDMNDELAARRRRKDEHQHQHRPPQEPATEEGRR